MRTRRNARKRQLELMAEAPIQFSGTAYQCLAQDCTTLDTGYGAGPDLASLQHASTKTEPRATNRNGKILKFAMPSPIKNVARSTAATGVSQGSETDTVKRTGSKKKGKRLNKFKALPGHTSCEIELLECEQPTTLASVKAERRRLCSSHRAVACTSASSISEAGTALHVASRKARESTANNVPRLPGCANLSRGDHKVCPMILYS